MTDEDMTDKEITALGRIMDPPASDATVEAVADLVLRGEAGVEIHRHSQSLLDDALPGLLVRIRRQNQELASAQRVIDEGAKLIGDQGGLLTKLNEEMESLIKKLKERDQ